MHRSYFMEERNLSESHNSDSSKFKVQKLQLRWGVVHASRLHLSGRELGVLPVLIKRYPLNGSSSRANSKPWKILCPGLQGRLHSPAGLAMGDQWLCLGTGAEQAKEEVPELGQSLGSMWRLLGASSREHKLVEALGDITALLPSFICQSQGKLTAPSLHGLRMVLTRITAEGRRAWQSRF